MMAEDSKSGARSQSLLYMAVFIKQFVESLYLKRNQRASIWADSSVILTRDMLWATSDNVQSPASIIFNVVRSQYGYFEKRADEENYRKVLKFSQDDINQHRIRFIHKSPTEDDVINFLFSITDGVHITSNLHTFELQVRFLRTTLSHLESLLVFPPLSMQRLTPRELSVTTNDHSNQAIITFHILRKPRFGKIVRVSGNSYKPILTPISEFTMDQINASRIAYQPFSTTAKKFTDISDIFYDTADVQINTKPTSMVRDFVLNISLSYRNIHADNQKDLLKIGRIELKEGSKFIINSETLNVHNLKQVMYSAGFQYDNVLFIVAKRPAHGDLKIHYESVDTGRVISMKELSGGLLYIHDDSDTVEDDFHLQVAFSPASVLRRDVLNITIPINIEPINDQLFRLTVNKAIQLVETSTIVVNSSYLRVEDPDTSDDNLLYVIRTPPALGDLYLLRDVGPNIITREICGRYCTFSQTDVNNGRLLYENKIFGNVDNVRFNVSDRRHTAHNYNLSISVQPYRMILKLYSVAVNQGDKYTKISADNIKIESFSYEVQIQFNITLLPNYGIILRDSTPVNGFTYQDILSGRIRYHQLDLSRSTDTLFFNVRAANENFFDHKLPIVVRPLITSSTLEINAGSSKPVLTTHLSADKLLKQVGVVPNFTLLRTTTYGRLFVFPLQNNERNTHYNDVSDSSTFWFTQEELRRGQLMYKAYQFTYTPKEPFTERINFTIRAGDDCQPAVGHLDVRIDYKKTVIDPIRNDKSGTNSHGLFPKSGGERNFLSGNMVMLVVSVSCIIGIIILGVITSAFLCWKRRHEQRDGGMSADLADSSYHSEPQYATYYRDQHAMNHSVSLLGNYPSFPHNGQTLPRETQRNYKPPASTLTRSVTYGSNYMAGVAAQQNKSMVTFSLSNHNIKGGYDTASTKPTDDAGHLILLSTVSRNNRQSNNETMNRRPRTMSGHSIVLEDQKLWV